MSENKTYLEKAFMLFKNNILLIKTTKQKALISIHNDIVTIKLYIVSMLFFKLK